MTTSIRLRAAGADDAAAIAALANRRSLPYQPPVREAAVRQAMAGESRIDSWWWERLSDIETVAAIDDAGSVAGACSWAVSGPEGAAYLLWVEATEDPMVTAHLLRHAMGAMDCTGVRAYWFATPLSLGLEGLPAGLSPVTHRALVEAGLAPRDLWLWMATDDLPDDSDEIAVVDANASGWKLSVERDGVVAAEAEVAVYGDIGVLWWIGVEEPFRGRGIGRALLRQALATVAGSGATSATLFVDHNDAASRDRRAAIALYESMGFNVVDDLFSYEYRSFTEDEIEESIRFANGDLARRR